jgi:hypothetical protein
MTVIWIVTVVKSFDPKHLFFAFLSQDKPCAILFQLHTALTVKEISDDLKKCKTLGIMLNFECWCHIREVNVHVLDNHLSVCW